MTKEIVNVGNNILSTRFGRGFSRPNFVNMRKFYLLYPNCQSVSDILTWSHICELMQAEDDLEHEHQPFRIEIRALPARQGAVETDCRKNC